MLDRRARRVRALQLRMALADLLDHVPDRARFLELPREVSMVKAMAPAAPPKPTPTRPVLPGFSR